MSEVLDQNECANWCERQGVSIDGKPQFPSIDSKNTLIFLMPIESRRQLVLADMLISALQFENALLWITDWSLYKDYEMKLFNCLRGSHEKLIDKPGWVLTRSAGHSMEGILFLMMVFLWDSFLLSKSAEMMIWTDNDNGVAIWTKDPSRLNQILKVVREMKLKILSRAS